MARSYRCRAAALLLFPTLAVALTSKLAKVKNYFSGDIAGDERVVFFPTVASKVNATHWRVPIHGWLFEPEQDSRKRKLAIDGIGSLFQVKDESELRYLTERMFPFVVDNQSMKFVRIKLGRKVYKLSRTSKDGHSTTTINIAERDLQPIDGMMTYQVIDDARKFEGQVFFVEDQGLSIISVSVNQSKEGGCQASSQPEGQPTTRTNKSKVQTSHDIDDTVKDTNYLDKKQFYANTFLRKFRSVPGMKDYFKEVKRKNKGCAVHFVSASPYQLFEQLRNFFRDEGFPEASYHLKRIRIKDKSLLQFFADPFDYKMKQIEPLMESFPGRKFILIGDSGEKDPEIYCAIYEKFPQQVQQVLIRNINDAEDSRMDRLPREKWQYFTTGFDLMSGI
ncbi:hypothetical protein THAOC_17085 [Thalassiosira oceanica]|uniref:Phosphatidate phosphatase APP1 catalytic domain-containing protein n=1 Tax=Thalassiosira oceanica TaxID=159749 RepID=K0S870_THAOC|nr:hypothetical protein THAOC_17085 [Thalassiosira oceanica]|eukprot:EJK62308.1 hypothetical protein THAOC_17085 [Thalassiosira oceanica]